VINKQWLERLLVGLLVFLIPTQLAFHFWPQYAFVFGIRIDYLSPTVYLTDVLIVSLLFFSFLIKDKLSRFPRDVWKKYKYLLFGLVVVVVANVVFSSSWQVSLFRWVKIFEFAFLTGYIFLRKKDIGEDFILKTLFYSAIFFSFIGVVQFLIGRTINGPLYFLGERNFNLSTPGIALVKLFDRDFLRAYSVFPHPNSFSGYLGIILILMFGKKLVSKPIYVFGYILLGITFLLTFSLSAFIALFMVAILGFFVKNKILLRRLGYAVLFLSIISSLLLPVTRGFSSQLRWSFGSNVSERLDLAYAAGKIISNKVLLGAGLGTFIVNLPKVREVLPNTWILQPVHNSFLLIMSEVGVFGVVVLMILFLKALQVGYKKGNFRTVMVIIFVLITGLFDHYWLTIQQNLLLLSIFFSLIF
jgi:O-antigen ligase